MGVPCDFEFRVSTCYREQVFWGLSNLSFVEKWGTPIPQVIRTAFDKFCQKFASTKLHAGETSLVRL
jgi:hypothetical protein